uniref:CD9 antigen-like isoform X2 n=1 Tax=Ciona intestinalis TaxID=7719 RepID=UPI000EF467EF|nr:CD9 antigen-like isoform X2 [Ciona intestinalis]|eukprot:XP_026692075.1 CD9 antigen-like isoform X2 [Ciona intestinalis]
MCLYTIAKYLLFAFNLIIWLAGGGTLGVGIWLLVDPSIQDSMDLAGLEIYQAGAIVFVVAGSLILIIGFFGCCGAIKESTCLLGTYFGFLFVIFGLQLGIGIWALVSYDSMETAINDAMKVKEGGLNQNDDANYVGVEQNLQCCGATRGCKDWATTSASYGCGCDPTSSNLKNISNCVLPNSKDCPDDTFPDTQTGHIYGQPCSEAIYDLIYDNLTIVGAIGLAVAGADILGMIISMCLCCNVKKK